MENFLFTSESVGEGHPGAFRGAARDVVCAALVQL